MSQDPNYQDQGSLDQPQQPVEPGAYQTPGVVPPEQQAETVDPPSMAQTQQQGGGAAAVPTPGEGEVQLPDGSIVPEGEATPEAIQNAQNNVSAAAPAPGGGAAAGGGETVDGAANDPNANPNNPSSPAYEG